MRMQPEDNQLGVEEKSVEPLNEEQRELAAKYVPLGLAIAREFSVGWSWIQDEMESAAMLALVDAARCFRASFNVKFATYARRRITGYLCDSKRKFLQAHYRQKTLIAEGMEWYSVKNTSNMSFDEMLDMEMKISIDYDRSEYGLGFEVQDSLEHCFRRLPSRHREVMRSIYFERDRSIEEIAKKYRVTPERLVTLHRQSLDMLMSGDSVPTPKSPRTRNRRSRPTDPGFPHKLTPERHQDTD